MKRLDTPFCPGVYDPENIGCKNFVRRENQFCLRCSRIPALQIKKVEKSEKKDIIKKPLTI
jgi:hypothetical protein